MVRVTMMTLLEKGAPTVEINITCPNCGEELVATIDPTTLPTDLQRKCLFCHSVFSFHVSADTTIEK